MNNTRTSNSIVDDGAISNSRRRRGRVLRRRVTGALAAGVLTGPALILGAAPAEAAETGVYVENGVLQVRAGAATTNRITINLVRVGISQWRYIVTDTGGGVVKGAGCSKENANTAYCSASGVSSVTISTGDRNDRINTDANVKTTVSAGEGNDYIDLHSASDIAYGGPGNDEIYGWSGKDRLHGESGDDTIYGHRDNDNMYGGEGTDQMYGGDGTDLITGEAGRDRLFGENGNDSMWGSQGPDSMYGGPGGDRMLGETGSDVMTGQDGDDRVNGGDDKDIVIGGTGKDQLAGGKGDDSLNSKDNTAGNDELWGEAGTDSCLYDPGDIRHTCES